MTTATPQLNLAFNKIVADFESTFARGDSAGIADFYSDDGMLLPSGCDFIKGKPAISAYWQEALDLGINTIELELVELEQHGNAATEVSYYTMRDADNRVIDHGKGIMLWKYDGDAWKMHRDIWTSNTGQ